MKKALNIIKNIFVWLVVIMAVCMMIFTIVSVNTFDRNDRGIFGYKAFIVLSDSMSKTDFDAGDVILIKEVDASILKEGDIIAYSSRNIDNFGENVTHKIRKLVVDSEGNPGFITYGTTTDTDDEMIVTYADVNGKYVGRIPKLGIFFQFLKSTPGYIVCILIPFLVLILIQGVNCIRIFRKYKAEQLAEVEAEKAKVEAERQKSQKIMAELLELKAKLAEKEAIKTENKSDTDSAADSQR